MNNLMGAMGENIQGVLSTDFWIGVFTPTPVLLRNTAGALYLYGLDRKTPAQLTVGPYLNINDNGVAGGIALANGSTNRGYIGIAEASGQFQVNAVAGDIVLRTAGGNLFLDTNNGSTTSSVNILAGNGYVGLFNSAPAYPLTITGPTTSEFPLGITGGLVSGSFRFTGIVIGQAFSVGNAANFGYMTNQSDNTKSGMYFTNFGEVEGTTGIFIKRGGSVGFSMDTPAHTIDVNGDVGIGTSDQTIINNAGLMTQYNNVATQGWGIPSVVSRVGLTAQGADIADTNLTNAGVVGEYIVYVYMFVTTSNAGGGAITCNIKWNDGTSARTQTVGSIALTSLTWVNISHPVRLGSGNITYGVTHTGIYSGAQYALYISCHRVN